MPRLRAPHLDDAMTKFRGPAADSAMPKLRVLLVDDEPSIRLAVRKWFERQGWKVDEAHNGCEACDLLEQVSTGYALVICDVHLPGLNGFAVAARIEEEWPEMLSRFVFSTGDTLDFTADQRRMRESTHVLLKPFEFSELRTLVTRIAHQGETAA